MEIRISHSHAEGTLAELYGQDTDSAVGKVLEGAGFVWFPSLDTYGVPRSRDTVAPYRKIQRLYAVLEAAGHDFHWEFDDRHRPQAVVRQEREWSSAEREARFTAAAERAHGAADAAVAAADAHSGRFEGGQPLLKGHHSYRAASRARDRMHNAMDRSFAASREARGYEELARAAARRQEALKDVGKAVRRISAAEAELRSVERALEKVVKRIADDEAVEREWDVMKTAAKMELASRRAQLQEQIAYDRELVRKAAEDGHRMFSRADIRPGDLVTIRGSLWEVRRVNAKTVSVDSGYSWVNRYGYEEITEVKRPEVDAK